MDLKAILMGLGFVIMWSSAFTSARIIVQDAPPVAALALRFLISGCMAIIIARMMGQSWRLTRNQWRMTIIFGICQNAVYLGFNFVAMQTIEASLAAIIASTMPLLVALTGWVLYRERIGALGIAGLFAGTVGVAIIMGTRLSGGADLYGVVLCGIGVIALTFATLAVRGATSGGNILMIVGIQMLVASIILPFFAFATEAWVVNWSWQLIAAFAYTTIVPGLIATWVWFLLVNRIGAVKAATFHFLNPFFGVAIAAVLLGEKLGPLDMVGVGIIAAGILAVQMSKQTNR